MSRTLPPTPGLPRPAGTESKYDAVLNRELIASLSGIAFVLNEETPKLGDGNIFTEAQIVRLDDAVNNAVSNGLTLSHTTTGTPANGIGVGLRFEVETGAGNNEVGATIEAVTTDVTVGSEDFALIFRTMVAGAAAAEIARFSRTATATHTGLMLYDVDNNAVERVTVGAADSGGVGFKALRIPN